MSDLAFAEHRRDIYWSKVEAGHWCSWQGRSVSSYKVFVQSMGSGARFLRCGTSLIYQVRVLGD